MVFKSVASLEQESLTKPDRVSVPTKACKTFSETWFLSSSVLCGKGEQPHRISATEHFFTATACANTRMRYGLERTPLKVQPFKVSEALYRKHVGFAKSYVFRKTFSLQLLLLSLFDSFFFVLVQRKSGEV